MTAREQYTAHHLRAAELLELLDHAVRAHAKKNAAKPTPERIGELYYFNCRLRHALAMLAAATERS